MDAQTRTSTYQTLTNANPVIFSLPLQQEKCLGVILEEFSFVEYDWSLNNGALAPEKPRYFIIQSPDSRGRCDINGVPQNILAIVPRNGTGEYAYKNEVDDLSDTDDYISQFSVFITDLNGNAIDFADERYKIALTFYLRQTL